MDGKGGCTGSDKKPLHVLHLTLVFSWSGKRQGILKRDICGKKVARKVV